MIQVPDVQEQLPLWLQPNTWEKVLIVIARFHCTEGVMDTAVHEEIKRAIEAEASDLNLRVEIEPFTTATIMAHAHMLSGGRWARHVRGWERR